MVSYLLLLCLLLGLGIPVLAAAKNTGFSDVTADSWYADAVVWCREQGLMAGTSATAFSPDADTSRAMLVTILHRRSGSPETAAASGFSDVSADAWYRGALNRAVGTGIISGYADGRFGPNDPVTREQLAAILWRYNGSPTPAGGSAAFADQREISPYAAQAVAWARENGLVSGREGNRFAPHGTATRAQLAAILYRWLNVGSPESPDTPEPPAREDGKNMVAYFSATGTTKAAAEAIAAHAGATLFEIVPEDPYTAADLNYYSGGRADREQSDPSARPAISGEAEDMEDYDVVFLGYPIWHGQAPRTISTFLESHDLAGKTIIPFCTSHSSGIGSSASQLHVLAPDADWLEGTRFGGGAPQSDINAWVDGLEY